MGRELLGRQGQGLSLVGRNISPNEKTGGAHHFGVGQERSTAACVQFIPYVHGEVKLRRRKDVSAHRSRRGATDFEDLSLYDGIGIIFFSDLVSAILLDLFDNTVGNQYFDARQ